jgi:hypothetical protein
VFGYSQYAVPFKPQNNKRSGWLKTPACLNNDWKGIRRDAAGWMWSTPVLICLELAEILDNLVSLLYFGRLSKGCLTQQNKKYTRKRSSIVILLRFGQLSII